MQFLELSLDPFPEEIAEAALLFILFPVIRDNFVRIWVGLLNFQGQGFHNGVRKCNFEGKPVGDDFGIFKVPIPTQSRVLLAFVFVLGVVHRVLR